MGAPDPQIVKLALELDRHADPVAGRLRRVDGTIVEFVGWLELTQTLEDARSDADPDKLGGPK